jgi:hypothetical protein
MKEWKSIMRDSFLTIVFRTRLQPYLRVAITGMKRENMQQHNKICNNFGL